MHARGSVLIEQLLAISLMSLLLVSVFSLLTVGSFAAQMAQEFSLAGGLAAQKLEEITGGREGPAPVAREPLDSARFPRHQWQADITEVGPALRQVTVTVWWPHRGRERSVSLTTLVRQQEER